MAYNNPVSKVRRRLPVAGFTFTGLIAVCFALAVTAEETTKTLWEYEFERSEVDGQVYYFDYNSSSEKIEIMAVSGISRDFAEQTIREKVFLFGSLFERQRVGYRGQHTEHVECKPGFKPAFGERKLADGILKYFKGFANDRFAFGACDETSISYSAVNAYFYCDPESTLYDLSYFSLMNDDQATIRFIDGIRCP